MKVYGIVSPNGTWAQEDSRCGEWMLALFLKQDTAEAFAKRRNVKPHINGYRVQPIDIGAPASFGHGPQHVSHAVPKKKTFVLKRKPVLKLRRRR